MIKIYNPAISKLQMPQRFKKLPVDERGYPVPKFVSWIDGKPDFRVVNGKYLTEALKRNLCWLCGETLGRHKAFVIGPMCAINRISSEPPSHLECAQFSVKACPFLTQPKRIRDKRDLPQGHKDPGGLMIERNPGVTLIWVTFIFHKMRLGDDILFKIGEPTRIECWTKGKLATYEETMASVNSGYPTLMEMAVSEGPSAVAELEKQKEIGINVIRKFYDTGETYA